MNLRGVDRVTHIVTFAVGNERDKAFGFAEFLTDQFDDVDILHFVMPADVVHFAHFALVDNEVDRFAMILDVQPVANVLALAVNGKRFVRKRVCGDTLAPRDPRSPCLPSTDWMYVWAYFR